MFGDEKGLTFVKQDLHVLGGNGCNFVKLVRAEELEMVDRTTLN